MRNEGGLWDVLDSIEQALCVDPRSCGESHPFFPDGRMWVYELPPLQRIPRTFILYEIDDERGKVTLWAFTTASAAIISPNFTPRVS